MFAPWVNPFKTGGVNGTKCRKHVHQKLHRTGIILALSSSLVNRETWGKVVVEPWRKCHIVVSETPHNPGKYQRTSSLMIKGAWKKRFRNFEDSAPFLLVIHQSFQENTSNLHQVFIGHTISQWMYGPGRHRTLRANNQRGRIKPLKCHQTYGRWNRDQGALVRWVKPDEQSTEKHNLEKPTSNEMFASWVNPIKTGGGNGTKKPNTCPSGTTPYRDRLSTIIMLRE